MAILDNQEKLQKHILLLHACLEEEKTEVNICLVKRRFILYHVLRRTMLHIIVFGRIAGNALKKLRGLSGI